jgi:IS30 family transposase
MPVQVQDAVWAGFRAGESLSRIARQLGLPLQHVRRFLAQSGGIRAVPARRSSRHLTVSEREEISRGLAAGESLRLIGVRLGRAHTTIGREVGRNGGPQAYRAGSADVAAFTRARRPKVSKLAASPRLRREVVQGLALDWSPQQFSHRLRLDHRGDDSMRVSHETIYVSLFQPTRHALPRGLHGHLRSGRQMRHPRLAKRSSGRGRIRDMVLIGDRPAEVEDRAVAGNWGGRPRDGAPPVGGGDVGGTQTRLLRLVALPEGIKAPPVRAVLVAAMNTIDAGMRTTLTWDRGREMAEHAVFTVQTGCQVYFCDPRSPWQRGANENTNRLLRQYLTKHADLRVHDQAALDAIADKLNTRPRQVLEWRTPLEAWSEEMRA